MTLTTILTVLGLVLIVVLLPVVLKLWRDDRQRVAAQKEAEQALLKQVEEQRAYVIESVRVITSAMRDGQCELTEGCLRLKGLLDNTFPELLQHPDLQVLETVWQRTEHIPRKEAFKRLELKKRRVHWKAMDEMEAELQEPIQRAVSHLQAQRWTT
ncbi:DUF2489 domain-containing protein [Pokkaliibacter sp. MBI-7]|nr:MULTISPECIES: DUF2489 domain-containing protein [Pokkaliibacter]MDH2433966.1 DUF2489 domain-containing protein [Pokkaliibacter sp. MBI-7]